MEQKSLVGDVINFRGMVYAPTNEKGVIFLFGKVAGDLKIYIEEIKQSFPDCIGRKFIGRGWARVAIEFEYKSSNFLVHGHNVEKCDIIVCWEHDWPECPIEVIELKEVIRNVTNSSLTLSNFDKEFTSSLEQLFLSARSTTQIRDCYEQLFAEVTKIDNDIWAKIGEKYIGLYSPQRVFASLRIKRMSIRVECFSRGIEMPDTVASRVKPKWVTFSVKQESDIESAVNKLRESYKRMKAAQLAGESTSFYKE
jgi:predicted transport protein